MDFLELFDRECAPRLDVSDRLMRGATFRRLFELLLEQRRPYYRLVETGCTRRRGNWGDGQSTLLFDLFLQHHDGCLVSVDINPDNCRIARELVTHKVQVVCGDSVAFLADGAATLIEPPIDLLYLDSFDLDPDRLFPSAFHHLKELWAAEPLLRPGSIIAVDDNLVGADGASAGKGMLVANFMAQRGRLPVIDGYQRAWIW
ncbi:MAG: class I SAM-dependent methyltransferase [Azospirillaceae bacterium]|nr:class I SAM-dependent methyltransferase [Azospirillaceae bacterium]